MRTAELRDIEGQWLANPSCPVHELRILRGEIEALAAATAELGRQCVWFEDAVTRQRQRLIEAARARRLLERLRERALDEFMIEMRRIEAAVLDDVRRREPALEWGT
jgi:flagellar export protein FliJ